MYTINNNDLNPLFTYVNGIKNPYNIGRQYLPKTYLHNGYVDIVTCKLIIDKNELSGRIMPYIMKKNDNVDIDNIDDWNYACKILLNNN